MIFWQQLDCNNKDKVSQVVYGQPTKPDGLQGFSIHAVTNFIQIREGVLAFGRLIEVKFANLIFCQLVNLPNMTWQGLVLPNGFALPSNVPVSEFDLIEFGRLSFALRDRENRC